MRLAKSNILLVSLLGSLLVYLVFRFLKTAPLAGWEGYPKAQPIAKLTVKYPQMLSLIQRTFERAGYSQTMIDSLMGVAMHETGGFTSDIFKENNNPWGMKVPRVRPNKVIGENRGHGVYASLEDAMQDKLLYLESMKYPKDVGDPRDHVDLMKRRGYFRAPLVIYKNGVLKWLDRIYPRKY